MKKRLGLVLFGIGIMMIFLVHADYELGDKNHEIEKSYGPGSVLKGWINISFLNEESSSEFEDSLGNKISLIEILRSDSDYSYDCSVSDCTSDYEANSGETSKSFSLSSGENKIFGFKFDEEIIDINSLGFDINSNAESSCKNQIEIDLFNDGDVDSGNNKSSGESCQSLKSYGCFDSGHSSNNYAIAEHYNDQKHCQRIALPSAPGFKIGADILMDGDNREISMELYNLYGESITNGKCTFVPSGDGENSCEIDFLVIKPREYYVCIYSEEAGNSKIKGYESENGCGFYGNGVREETASFSIFVEGKKYGAIGDLIIDNNLPNDENFASLVKEYIVSKYGSLDCSEKDCVVPISFNSNVNQDVQLNSLDISYTTNLGSSTADKFYEVNEIPAVINSEMQKLNLDKGNFSLPEEIDSIQYKLDFKNEELFNEEIIIKEIADIKGLTPMNTYSGLVTRFELKTDEDLEKYEWNFGDGTNKTTTINSVSHTYNQSGSYTIEIIVTNSEGLKNTEKFRISVDSPEKFVEDELNEMQENLQKIKEDLKKLEIKQKEELEKIINLEEIESDIRTYQREFASSESEDEFIDLAQKISLLKVPEYIFVTKKFDSATFLPRRNSISPEIVSELSVRDYDTSKEEDYIESILLWNIDNVEIKITFKEFKIKYKNEEKKFRFFKIKTKDLQELSSNPYFIIHKMDNLTFLDYYAEEDGGDYYYIKLIEPENIIEFYTIEDYDFTNVLVFISPEIDEVEPEEIGDILPPPPFKLTNFILILILLFILGLIIYIVMQEWYKKKYEDYLFRNKNNLYNLLLYIGNATNKGFSEKEIFNNLKKVGWDAEQINYAVRKYMGKRTGMLEIPVTRFLDKLKIKKKMKEQKHPKLYMPGRRVMMQPPQAVKKPSISMQPRMVQRNPIRRGNLKDMQLRGIQ